MKRLLVIALLFLSACTSSLVDYERRTYIVQPGDTLYSIAWRHGVDHQALARWNRLRDPDVISVGQGLVLRADTSVARAPASSGRSTVQPRRRTQADPQPAWQWPTSGPVVSAYGGNDALATGVGIAGRAGQAVSAAAEGRVVYTGNGSIGYGQLIIIKHNETYLSAYGYNQRVLVRQGDQVRRGQRIAEMGLGPEQRPRLHFEIRRNGVPIDPMPYLRSTG